MNLMIVSNSLIIIQEWSPSLAAFASLISNSSFVSFSVCKQRLALSRLTEDYDSFDDTNACIFYFWYVQKLKLKEVSLHAINDAFKSNIKYETIWFRGIFS